MKRNLNITKSILNTKLWSSLLFNWLNKVSHHNLLMYNITTFVIIMFCITTFTNKKPLAISYHRYDDISKWPIQSVCTQKSLAIPDLVLTVSIWHLFRPCQCWAIVKITLIVNVMSGKIISNLKFDLLAHFQMWYFNF